MCFFTTEVRMTRCNDFANLRHGLFNFHTAFVKNKLTPEKTSFRGEFVFNECNMKTKKTLPQIFKFIALSLLYLGSEETQGRILN